MKMNINLSTVLSQKDCTVLYKNFLFNYNDDVLQWSTYLWMVLGISAQGEHGWPPLETARFVCCLLQLNSLGAC